MTPPEFLLPEWQAPASVRAACSQRVGGKSCGPYAGLNLGDHVGDDPEAVAANRRAYAGALGATPVFLNQVHGTRVAALDRVSTDPIEAGEGNAVVADACYTTQRGIACTIMVADCLPVLLTDVSGSVVGAAHAGWRGLAGTQGVGVLEALVGALPVRPDDLMAWLGPCIGPEKFEVGDEVREAFLAAGARHAPCHRYFAPGARAGKWWADLQGLARYRLDLLGVRRVSGNDGTAAWCTVTQSSKFFSHRRDGVSGRFAASIWRV